MTVGELIAALADMPQDAGVWALWDGAARSEINLVWLARDGKVVTADGTEPAMYDDDRPVDAPTRDEDNDWPLDDSL